MKKSLVGHLILERYEVISVFEGGMGIVYKCVDHEKDRILALKTFKYEFIANRQIRDRFSKEASTWISLGKHPNIVRAYRVLTGDQSAEMYLSLEWVQPGDGNRDASLRSWLQVGEALTIDQSVTFALQVARGMKFATSKIPDLVHRDIKPENILVGSENSAKVTDFGLVRTMMGLSGEGISSDPRDLLQLGRIQPIQLTNSIAGTMSYMAPEQWSASTPLDCRADIYAFGCVLYEMLTGRSAITGRDIKEIELKHINGIVDELPSSIPRGLSRFVNSCLSTNREARPINWSRVESSLIEVYEKTLHKRAPEETTSKEGSFEDEISKARSFYDIGSSYIDLCMYQKAKPILARALELSQKVGDQTLEGRIFFGLANIECITGELESAINLFERSKAIAEETGDDLYEASAIVGLATIVRRTGNPKLAVVMIEKALAISQEAGHQRQKVSILNDLGSAYLDYGNLKHAIGLFQQAMSAMQEVSDYDLEGIIACNLGTAYHEIGDLERSILYRKQALDFARRTGDRSLEGYTLGNLGTTLVKKGDLKNAIDCLHESVNIAREIGDRGMESTNLFNVGSVYYRTGNMREMIACYERSLALDMEIGDVNDVAQVSAALAQAYSFLGQSSRALEYIESAISIVDGLGYANKSRNYQQIKDDIIRGK